MADEYALSARVEGRFEPDRQLLLWDPLPWTAGRHGERELQRFDQGALGNFQRGGLKRHHRPFLGRSFFDVGANERLESASHVSWEGCGKNQDASQRACLSSNRRGRLVIVV